MIRTTLFAVVLGSSLCTSGSAFAWGDEGHEIVALIADHYLTDVARQKAEAMIAADPTTFTEHELAAEATWADRFRDSDRSGTKEHYNKTHQWHYVDTELDAADLDAACLG